MLKKADFHKGQTVYMWDRKENRIEDWEVLTVGRKYLTIRSKKISWLEIKIDYDSLNDTINYGCKYYRLFISEEHILRYQEIEKMRSRVKRFFDCGLSSKIRYLTVEDLATINALIEKYDI